MKKKLRRAPPGFRSKLCEGGRQVFPVVDLDVRTVQVDVRDELSHLTRFRTQFQCVEIHLTQSKNRYFWKIDLKKAFEHVTLASIVSTGSIPSYVRYNPMFFFHKNGKGGLIQGAPASPQLFQLFCQSMLDPQINVFCERNNITYTRFVDDLLFSSKVYIGKPARERIRRIIRGTGFQVNEDKEELVDTYKLPITYLGIEIFRNEVSPEKKFLEKLENEELDNARKRGMISWKKQVLALNRRWG